MLPAHRVPTHPGEVLSHEFLEPLGITQSALAAHLGTSIQRINELVRGKRSVTPDTAWALAAALGTSPELWLQLQNHHDLLRSRPRKPVRRLRAA